MPSHPHETLRRELYADPGASSAEAAHGRRVLRLLLAQDGSTTRLCETVAGGAVALQVLHQQATSEVPAIVREQLPGHRFIERITCLSAHGAVLMDNLSYIALEGLELDIERDLHAGTLPIGHLLARWWVRREGISAPQDLPDRLWSVTGSPDAGATRCYRILTPESPRMLICETYRRGMLMDRG
jgi:chorismate-pyruvate lyase